MGQGRLLFWWRVLISGAFALGLTLAADSVFLLRGFEIAFSFVAIFFATFILLWIVGTIWRWIKAAFSGAPSVNYLTQSFIWLGVLALAYWGGTQIFSAVDRACRMNSWPEWYCF